MPPYTEEGGQAAPLVIERFVEPCILLLLGERPACGYELFQRIRVDCHYPAVDLPNVYRTLRQLEAHDMVAAIGQVGPRQKQLYILAPMGERFLAEWMDRLRHGNGVAGQLIERYERQQAQMAAPQAGAVSASRQVQVYTGEQSGRHNVQERDAHMYKVVIEYSVAGHEEEVFGQISHMLDEFEEAGLDLVVVAHGDGIGLVSDSAFQDDIRTLSARGVTFLGCAATLQRRQLGADVVLPGAATTPGALAEIIRREHEGYAYLRPF